MASIALVTRAVITSAGFAIVVSFLALDRATAARRKK
jgi:hypothetical protein